MNLEATSELRSWSAGRWCGGIVLIFGLQVALIFWLSDRAPVPKRVATPLPVLQPADMLPEEFLALNDPTWFALPHPHGFSGRAWMQVPALEFHPFTWTNPPAWLLVPQAQAGAALYAFVRSNDFGAALSAATPDPVLTLPEPDPLPLARERSELRREGGLAQRTLLMPLALKSQPSADLLTNSVVQAVVDAKGWPQTVTLLESSGSTRADQEALELAAMARFAPLPGGAEPGKAAPAPLTEGLLVFAWHTVPATNPVAATSP